jgi:hypothetical protein
MRRGIKIRKFYMLSDSKSHDHIHRTAASLCFIIAKHATLRPSQKRALHLHGLPRIYLEEVKYTVQLLIKAPEFNVDRQNYRHRY